MESTDNRIGFVLAVSSSAFIGLSFIIKKKGLMRARASGRGAGNTSLFDNKLRIKFTIVIFFLSPLSALCVQEILLISNIWCSFLVYLLLKESYCLLNLSI